MKIKRLFLLSWKKLLIALGVGCVSVVLHNILSAFIGGEEGVFFVIAIFIVPLYIVAAFLYTIYKKVIR